MQQLKGLGEGMAKKLASCTPPVVNLHELGMLSVGKLEVDDTVYIRSLPFCGHLTVYTYAYVVYITRIRSREAGYNRQQIGPQDSRRAGQGAVLHD